MASASFIRTTLSLVAWSFAWPVLFMAGLLTDPAARGFARIAGWIAYHLLRGERARTLRNLELVFGDNMTEASRRRLALAVFRHHALTFCEIARMTPEWLDKHVRVEGMEIARDHAARASGAVVIGGHLGNFEILSAVWARLGFSNTMMARPLDNVFLERSLAARRARYGTRTAARGRVGLREMIRRLRGGEAVALAIDLNTIKNGAFVNAWGIPASTPRGPAAIALRENVPVALLVTWRECDGSHRVKLCPPFELIRTGDHERDVAANLQRFTDEFQRHVLRHPDQYYWQHARWRTRPGGVSHKRGDAHEKALAQERIGPAFPAPPGW